MSSCSDSETLLVVELRTDLVAGREFDEVATRVDDHEELSALHEADSSNSYVEGQRIAEIRGIPSGDRRIVVSLRLGGSTVVERPVSFRIEDTRQIVVVLSRDCSDVTCADEDAAACLGGACVPEDCTPDTPESCPAAECESAADCPEEAGCADSACVAGVCLRTPNDADCGPGQLCDVDRGCVINPDSTECAR